MNELVVITQSFPWGVQTDFLEDEIRALAESFDSVVIVPRYPTGKRRSVPANVDVDTSLASSSRRWRRALAASRPGTLPALWKDLSTSRHCFHPTALARGFFAAGDLRLVRGWALRRRTRPTMCYTYWLGPAAAGLRAAWPDVPIVSRAHGGDIYHDFYDPPYLPLQHRSMAACDAVAAVSEHGADYLRRLYPDLAPRISVRRLGTLGPPCLTPQSTDDVIRVVSCSSLTSVKRPLLLAAGVCELAGRGSSVHWVHIGDGPLRADLEWYLDRSAPSSLTVELIGSVPHVVVMERLAEGPFDAFVNVSESEGVPVSLMEAQSFGIPVVATVVGGNPEVVAVDLNVHLPSDTTPGEVGDAIQRAAGLPISQRQRRRERWQATFDASRNYAEFSEWLRDFTEAKRP